MANDHDQYLIDVPTKDSNFNQFCGEGATCVMCHGPFTGDDHPTLENPGWDIQLIYWDAKPLQGCNPGGH